MVANQELTGTYLGHRFEFGDTVVGTMAIDADDEIFGGRCTRDVTVKGPADGLTPQGTFLLLGHWKDYTNPRTQQTERQFHFNSAAQTTPSSEAGIVAYLVRASRDAHGYLDDLDGQEDRTKTTCGVGPAKARKAFAAWGEATIDQFREEPDAVAHLLRLDPAKIRVLAEYLERNKRIEKTTIAVTNMLDGLSFPKHAVRESIKLWGVSAAERIQADPYGLQVIRGVGWKLCDSLYLRLGYDPRALRRQAGAIAYSLVELAQRTGSTWQPWKITAAQLGQMVPDPSPEVAKIYALETKMIRSVATHEDAIVRPSVKAAKELLSSYPMAAGEEKLARLIAKAQREQNSWPDPATIEGVSDHQRQGFRDATRSTIGILQGAGGTGKTHLLARALRAMADHLGGWSKIAVCAPTGKAAVRLTEFLHANECSARATTIHSLLKVQSTGEGGWSFEFGEDNLLPVSAIVVDEMSMVPNSLLLSLIKARQQGCRVLLVGDTHQLPPVEAGAPMRDMIASGAISVGELLEIHRNSGGILEACDAIRRGQNWTTGDNLRIAGVKPDRQAATLLELIESYAADGFDPIWDCQPIVGVNEKSPVSRAELNKFLARELNPRQPEQGHKFAVGDKIVNTKNGMLDMVDPGDVETVEDQPSIYVANGELGEVLAVEQGKSGPMLLVEMKAPRRIVAIPAKFNEFDHAWALTCHKCQGSQFTIAMPVIDRNAGRVCDRSWIYTAISRAEKFCHLVGNKATADQMARRVAIDQRKTLLRQMIALEMCKVL